MQYNTNIHLLLTLLFYILTILFASSNGTISPKLGRGERFAVVNNLQIHFDILEDLPAFEGNRILEVYNNKQQQQFSSSSTTPDDDINNTHPGLTPNQMQKLLRAECLYEYILTGQRSTHCNPQLQQTLTTVQNTQGINNNDQNHPLLVPLPSYHDNSILSTLADIHTHEKFLSTSILPPFGETISVSFNLQQPQQQQQQQYDDNDITTQDEQLPFDDINLSFNLEYNSNGITPNTRIRVVDNNNNDDKNNNNNLQPQSEDSHNKFTENIIANYSTIGSSYKGYHYFENGSKATLLLTILAKGHIDATLIYNDKTYILQPSNDIAQTYTRIKQQQEQVLNNNNDKSSIKIQAIHNTIDDILTKLDNIAGLSTTTTFTSSQFATTSYSTQDIEILEDKITNVFAHLYSPIDDLFASSSLSSPHQQATTHQRHVEQHAKYQLLTQNDLAVVSNLFFADLAATAIDKKTHFETMSSTSSSSSDLLKFNLQAAQPKFQYVAAYFQQQTPSSSSSTPSTTTINGEEVMDYFNCAIIDPNTGELIYEDPNDPSTHRHHHHHHHDTQDIDLINEEEEKEYKVDDDDNVNNNNTPLSTTPHLKRWKQCIRRLDGYDDSDKRFHYGLVVDYGAYVALGSSIGNVIARMQSTLAYGNNIFPYQIGLTLTLDELIIYTSWDRQNDPQFNNDGTNSGNNKKTESQLLSYIGEYKKKIFPTRLGVLGLVTTLFSPPGVVGLATLGTTGLPGSSYWANLNFYHPMINNHEFSHTLRAQHTFSPNQGSIMSYDLSGMMGSTDPDNVGEVGLHSRLTKPEVCAHLSSVFQSREQDEKSPNARTNGRIPLDIFISPLHPNMNNDNNEFLIGNNTNNNNNNNNQANNNNNDVDKTQWNNDELHLAHFCGDGIVQGTEECDLGSFNGRPHTPGGKICCTIDCKLTPSSTCTPRVTRLTTPQRDAQTRPEDRGKDDAEIGNNPFTLHQNECCEECVARDQKPCGNLQIDKRLGGMCTPQGECITHGCYALKGMIPCSYQSHDKENSCIWQCAALNQTESQRNKSCYNIPYPTSYTYQPMGTACTLPTTTNNNKKMIVLDDDDNFTFEKNNNIHIQGTPTEQQQQQRGICVIPNYPHKQTYLKPYSGQNYNKVEHKPICQKVQYELIVTNDNAFDHCQCNGWATKKISCVENGVNIVNMDQCLFEENIKYPINSAIRCIPPPYCKL